MSLDVEADLQVDNGAGGERQLSVDDFKTAATGAAKETTLEAVRLLLATGLATEAKLEQVRLALVALNDYTDGLEALLSSLDITVTGVALDTVQIEEQLTGIFTELLQKLEAGDITGLATSARQDALQETLAAVLAKLIAAPATEAKQDVLISHIDGVEGSLGTLNGKDFATEATQARRYAGGKSSKTASVTASGDTTIHTPEAGKKIRLFWVSAINDPDQSVSPRVIVKFGSTELYRAYAIAHWEVFDGAVDEPLVVNLDQAADVAVTVHYQEV